MPRTARIAPGGVIFHVLNRANARARIFKDDKDYAGFVGLLAETAARVPPVRILAYCIMSNHWHLLRNISLPPISPITDTIGMDLPCRIS